MATGGADGVLAEGTRPKGDAREGEAHLAGSSGECRAGPPVSREGRKWDEIEVG